MHSCRVDAGQYTRLKPAVNLDSGVGGLTKGTMEQQRHNTGSKGPTKQEVWCEDAPEDGAETCRVILKTKDDLYFIREIHCK
jgi:hypothetical protein